MARLQFYDYHNMVTILEKSEHNIDFHPMVDFIEASPLRYALTVKPTVYVCHIRQFWSTASIETTEEGTQILATVDGIHRTVTESSLKRNLKLKDNEGISSLPDTELFENLTLMGYNISPNQKFNFQKEDREGVSATRSRDDALIKGRSMDEGEAATERISDDSKEMATVPTSIDAATEYHQFVSELPIERKIELITDLVKYQDNYAKIYKYQSQQRKLMTKKQKRDYYMAVIKNNLGWKVKDFRGITFEEVEAKFNSVWKQMEDFILMGSKKEAERIKRKGLNLEQESTKKQKTSEEVLEEAMSPKEVPEEKVKKMMQLVPIEEVYVEALQVKHPIIDWKVYTEGQRSYWKITRLVKETLSNRPPTNDKEMELWVELSRVHHVTSKDKEIFMLVEKDYPLRKGLALVMISYKLQVENYSQMANDLILKIYKIVNSPRQQEQLPIASEESCHCQKKSKATARKIALLSKVKKKLSVKVK
nr:hypothetical protein [Tanacetum cinerariifolium]